MTYQRDLAYALRLRNLDEGTIADIVREVDAHEQAHGDPREFFGPPETYAEQFPARPRSRRNLVPTYVGVALGVAWLLGVLVLTGTDLLDAPIRRDAFALWPAVGLIALGMVVNVVVLRNRPVGSGTT